MTANYSANSDDILLMWILHKANLKSGNRTEKLSGASCGWRVFAWTFVLTLTSYPLSTQMESGMEGKKKPPFLRKMWKMPFVSAKRFRIVSSCGMLFALPFCRSKNHYSTVGESCMRWILRFRFVIQPSGCLTVFPRKLFSLRSRGYRSQNLKLSGRRLGRLPMIREVLPATNIQLNCFGRALPDYGNFPAFIDCRKDDKKKYKCRKASPTNRNVFRVYCP